MSRLIDKFHQASRDVTTPMGFRTSRPATATPKILLIASMEAGTVENTAAHLNGADALLIRFKKAPLVIKNIQKIASSLPGMPLGLHLVDDDNNKATKAGADFVVFTAANQFNDIPEDTKIGKILEVESSMDDGLLRAVNNLPVDAVLVADTFEDDSSLVWHQMMIFQHLANMLGKPLIVQVPVVINDKELKAIWDAGVDSIVVEIDAVGWKRIQELRQAIDKLPPRTSRKHGKVSIVLPRTSSEASAAPPPDEEEEEDE
jgi:hypothetical protein